MAGVPVGDTTLLDKLRERGERVLAAYAEMDALHKAMYPRDGGPPDADMKLHADGLCLSLADSAFIMADALPAVITLMQAARAVCDAGDRIVAPGDYWSERQAASLADLRAALAPFVGEATQ